MIAAVPNHIRIAADGTAWIDDINVKVIEVVRSYFAADGSVPWLVENHPHLTPARIHAAMAWYHDHQEEFDRRMETDDRLIARLAAESHDPSLARKLRAARDARG